MDMHMQWSAKTHAVAPIGPPILSIEAAGGFSLVLCSLISCDSVPWPGQHYDFVYHYSDSWKSSDIEAMWLTYRSDNVKSKKHWRIKLVHSNNGGLYIEAQRAKGPVGLGDWKPKPFFLSLGSWRTAGLFGLSQWVAQLFHLRLRWNSRFSSGRSTPRQFELKPGCDTARSI